MGLIASQITSLTIVYSIIYSDADQRKHQSSASLAFVRGIHRGPVNSPHKWPVTRKMFPFDDVIMLVDSIWNLQVCNNAHKHQWIVKITSTWTVFFPWSKQNLFLFYYKGSMNLNSNLVKLICLLYHHEQLERQHMMYMYLSNSLN